MDNRKDCRPGLARSVVRTEKSSGKTPPVGSEEELQEHNHGDGVSRDGRPTWEELRGGGADLELLGNSEGGVGLGRSPVRTEAGCFPHSFRVTVKL